MEGTRSLENSRFDEGKVLVTLTEERVGSYSG